MVSLNKSLKHMFSALVLYYDICKHMTWPVDKGYREEFKVNFSSNKSIKMWLHNEWQQKWKTQWLSYHISIAVNCSAFNKIATRYSLLRNRMYFLNCTELSVKYDITCDQI